MAVSLAMFKKHVYADDFTADDEYLQHLLDTAEAYIIQSTNRTSTELSELGGGSLPVQLVHAIYLTAGHWYNQRESVSSGQMSPVPETTMALVKPFVKLIVDTPTTSDDSTSEIDNP